MRNYYKSLLSGSALAVLLATGPAFAAENADTAEQGEIVVTAQRREQALSKVPISVAAFTQEAMDQQNVRSVEDITRLTPGLTLTRTGRGNGGQTNISIRGIRSETGTATTGIYIDDTPVQVRPLSRSGVNPYPRIFDLDRVEVLRGPQGTLFGAGSEGGTVRFITPTPSLSEHSVYARAEVAVTEKGSESYEAGAAFGGPLIEDKLGIRASLWGRKDGGWVDRVNYNTGALDQENANSGDAIVGRVALRWKPVETVELTPSFFYQRTTGDDSAFFNVARSNPGEQRFVNAAFIPAPSKDTFWLAALKGEVEIGAVTLVSNTSYFHRNAHNVHDSTLLNYFQFTGLTAPTLPAALVNSNAFVRSDLYDKQRNFVQEVRLQNADSDARLNWVVGLFYSHARQSNEYLDGSSHVVNIIRQNPTYVARFGPSVTPEQAFNGVSLVNGMYSLRLTTNVLDEQIAGFGQLDFKITPELTATAGIRYSDVKYHNAGFSAGVVVSSNGTATDQTQRGKEWTPKFGLSWQVDPDNLIYGSAARGFRPGSYVGPGVTRCAADLEALGLGLAPREISPDYVWSYEAGVKSKLFSRRLSIDASAYQIDWKGIQSQINLPVCGTSTTANLGKARSRGFDLAMVAQVTPALQLSASVGYNDSKYTETTFGAINPTTGARGVARSKGEPLGSAPWTLVLSGRYDFPVGGVDAYVRSDFQYSSKDNTPLDRVAAAVDLTIPRTPAYSNLDLRVGAKMDAVELSVFVANVTNSHPTLALYRDTTRSAVYRGISVRPRTFGLTATFRN